jgi:Zn-dependent protease with chaperone function
MRLRFLLLGLLAAATAQADARLYLVSALADSSDSAPLRAQSVELQAMYDTLAARAGVEATLLYADTDETNAFATEVDGRKVVVLNRGLVEQLADDRDAVAAVIGHELAHHKADHVRAGQRKQQGIRALGALLGAMVGARLGNRHGELAGMLGEASVGVGASLVALKFSRNQELEADRLGVAWLVASGYDPAGMLRLQTTLATLGDSRGSALFSTHPASDKRLAAVQRQLGELPPSSSASVKPLVEGERLAAAENTVRAEREAQLARALRPAAPAEIDPVALTPVEGIDLAAYAVLSNRLARADAAERAALLQQHRLDEDRYHTVERTYRQRLRESAALRSHFQPLWLEASHGPLAAHAHELAAALREGRELALPPPYPLDSAVHFLRAISTQNALQLGPDEQSAFEAEVLAGHGLDLYDVAIGNLWWQHKARIEAVRGEPAAMEALAAVNRPTVKEIAARAGVHIGDNVRIGKGVRFGGQEVPVDD